MQVSVKEKQVRASKLKADELFPNLNIPLDEMERIGKLEESEYAIEVKAFAKKYYEVILTDLQVNALRK
jgi:hypothetical protein